jgi:hypothetical protein
MGRAGDEKQDFNASRKALMNFGNGKLSAEKSDGEKKNLATSL